MKVPTFNSVVEQFITMLRLPHVEDEPSQVSAESTQRPDETGNRLARTSPPLVSSKPEPDQT